VILVAGLLTGCETQIDMNNKEKTFFLSDVNMAKGKGM
jgi:hypothetical protein